MVYIDLAEVEDDPAADRVHEVDVPQHLGVPDGEPIPGPEPLEVRRVHVPEVHALLCVPDPLVRDPERGLNPEEDAGRLLARVPRPARGRVVLAERLDVDAEDLPEGGPLEPPVQLALLDWALPAPPAVALVRNGRAVVHAERPRLADAVAREAQRLEREPTGRVRMAGPVAVHELPDLLAALGQILDDRLHLGPCVHVGGADDLHPRGEVVEVVPEVLPVVVDPARVAPVGVRDVDQPPGRVLRPGAVRELSDLPRARLPLVLRVQHEAMDHPVAFLLERAADRVSEHDLTAEAADVLKAADGEAGVHDDVLSILHERPDLVEEFVRPVHRSPRMN